MKLAFILPILFGGLIGGITDNNSFSNKIEQFFVRNVIQDNSVLTAYIDGENKVYFNDINDSSIVEDSWKNTEVKTLTLNLDYSNFDSKTKYLEINLPLGMELKMTPESIIDNKNILSVDASKFRLNRFSKYNNTTYIANQGCLVYEISELTQSIDLNLLVSVDNKLWNTQSQYACNEDEIAIEISIGDKDKKISKKIDRINIVKDFTSPGWGSDYDFSTVLQNTNSFYQQWCFANRNYSLFKEIIVELEMPYAESTVDGTTVKKYAEVKDIKIDTSNATYEILDNKILFKYKNYDNHLIGYNFQIYADKEIFSPNEKIYVEAKEIRAVGYLDETEVILTRGPKRSATIISCDEEMISLTPYNRTVHADTTIEDDIHIIGGVKLYNNGIDTNRKKLIYNFPKNEIGITALRIPTGYYETSYDIKVNLWNRKTNIEDIVVYNVKKTANSNSTILIKVADIVKSSSLAFGEGDYYISSIEYDIGVLKSRYDTGYCWIYGEILEENMSKTYQTEFILKDLDDNSVKDKCLTVKTALANTGTSINTRVLNTSIKDMNDSKVIDVVAGNKFKITGTINIYNYPWNNSSIMANPRIYLKLPKGLKIDSSLSKLIHINSDNSKENVSFKILNENNPRVFDDGDMGYTVDIENKKLIGSYDRDLKSHGDLYFEIVVNVNKSAKSLYFDTYNRFFITDEKMGSSGIADVLDIDNDGDFSEHVTTFSEKISIVSSTNWLNVDNSVKNEEGVEDKYSQEITENYKKLNYGLNINNSNEGTVRAGNLEYYIPIPKMNLEYNSYVKPTDVDFNFDMELSSIPINIDKHKVMYSYNNIDYFDYKDDIDISRVSMVKLVNTEEIEPGDNYDFYIEMKYIENSWNKESNINSWSAYGVQTYTKNNSDSTYVHVFDPLKIELKLAPKTVKNPESVKVVIGEDAVFYADFDLGAPLATVKWQYRKSSTSEWINLNESSNALSILNVQYSMNGYEYRCIADNGVSIAESQSATLNVVDISSPIINLTEIKKDGVYKIQINVSDIDNGVSHIILPDGTRINSDSYILEVEPNATYEFKAYDLAGNEAVAKISIMGELERKTVSSNFDLYVKSENALSLSLDTNNVIFENYSGVEDIEHFNAINLTVSSSLPYKIGACIVSNIQNSDKSEILDLNLLNIKANSDSIYQTFNAILSPIVLLDYQNEGNRITHGVDLKLKGNLAHKVDVYKTTIKFEVEQR